MLNDKRVLSFEFDCQMLSLPEKSSTKLFTQKVHFWVPSIRRLFKRLMIVSLKSNQLKLIKKTKIFEKETNTIT